MPIEGNRQVTSRILHGIFASASVVFIATSMFIYEGDGAGCSILAGYPFEFHLCPPPPPPLFSCVQHPDRSSMFVSTAPRPTRGESSSLLPS